jgi:Septum formation
VSFRAYVACALLVFLLGCSAENQPPEAEPTRGNSPPVSTTPAVAPPEPKPRACYRLNLNEALAPTSDQSPVPCRARWTTRTFHIGALDTVTADGHLLAVDSSAAQAHVARECPQRLGKYLGGAVEDLRLSVFQAIWFTPTLTESTDGANWFRCDVVALAKPGRLARLSGTLRGILDRDYSAYALCATAKPGTPGFARVRCAEPQHTWRALRSVAVPGRKYPGADQVRALGVTACTEAARAVATDALDFQWGYEWPTEAMWEGRGNRPRQRYGLCWAPADGS